MSASESILLGIVAGVIATLVVFGLNAILQKIVLPWYQNLVYDGVAIAGEWDLLGESEQFAKLILNQSAYVLTGTVTFVSREENPAEYEALRVCSVKGTVREKLVELSFRHVDRARLGAGVLLLEVKGDGRRMSGVQSMYSVYSSQMTAVRVYAFRPGFFKAAQPELPLTTPLLPPRRKKTRKRSSPIERPTPHEPPKGPVAGG